MVFFYIKVKVPKFLVYDDACHLKPFCVRHSRTTERATIFNDIIYVIDKLHIVGHPNVQCQTKFNPNNFPELKETNTVICEQINFILGKFKYIFKHMNFVRFNFFLYIILDAYNLIKIYGKYQLNDIFRINKIRPFKRKYHELDKINH